MNKPMLTIYFFTVPSYFLLSHWLKKIRWSSLDSGGTTVDFTIICKRCWKVTLQKWNTNIGGHFPICHMTVYFIRKKSIVLNSLKKRHKIFSYLFLGSQTKHVKLFHTKLYNVRMLLVFTIITHSQLQVAHPR